MKSGEIQLGTGDETRKQIRAHHWARTPLGAVDEWPPSLRTAAAMVVDAALPMCVCWGEELVLVHNAAWGERVVDGLGRRAQEVFAGEGGEVEAMVRRVMAGRGAGRAFWEHAPPGGELELLSSPIRDEDDCIAGVLVVGVEAGGAGRGVGPQPFDGSTLHRAIVEQGPAALAVLEGPEHRFVLVSPTYEAWAAHGPLLGCVFVDALPELRDSAFDRAHREVYTTGASISVHEVAASVDRDGDGVPEDYWFTVHYTALRDAAGAVYAVACQVVDASAEVRAKREVEQARRVAETAQQEAEAANRAKSEFLAVMSHELRTPLNAIGGYAELIEMGIRGPVTEAQRTDLQRIQRSQHHLLGLINEVLDYAKLESGSVRLDIVDLAVEDVCAAAASLIAPQAEARRLTLRRVPLAQGLTVRADADKLRQILLNLLSNAVKFTDAGGSVDLICDGQDHQVRFRVRDTGMGIPADHLERVFEPFVQVHTDPRRAAQGTGLGLAISRDLARAMGGDLTVQSTVDAGSTFTLMLPRGEVEREEWKVESTGS